MHAFDWQHMFSKIQQDLNRRILIESMRPGTLETMARAALENPHHVRTIRPRTPTWDYKTWLDEGRYFVNPLNPSFIVNGARFNRMTQM